MDQQIRSDAGGLLMLKRVSNLINPFKKSKMHRALKWLLSINGLVFTILLGIVINSTSNFLQDKIQRQRYLELLQLEIRMNHGQAKGDIEEFEKNGIILNFTPFRTEVYDSGLESGYLLTIDPDQLARLYVLYTTTLPKLHKVMQHQSDVIKSYEVIWEQCILNSAITNKDWKTECVDEDYAFRSVEKSYSKFLYDSVKHAEKNLWEASAAFSPTQERLNSPLLRLFMGTNRLKIQDK